MTGRWFIDNIDIYKKYNIGITKSGFNDLFLFPSLTTPYINDWQDQNGIDPDLDNPLLDNKNVNISFASVTDNNREIDSFLAFIASEGYKVLDIRSLGKTFQLRASTENNRTVYRNAQSFTVQFIDDFPRGLLNSTANKQGHGFTNLPKSKYLLDGVRLDEYGIVVEQGKAEIFKMPALKQNLERKISNRDSVIYDTGIARFQSKDVTLKCALYCDSTERFWKNYYSFFGALVKPNERMLTVEYAEDTYSCFYKNTANPVFYRSHGYVLLRFDLVLTFTRFRPMTTVYIWGTEAKEIIKTEDNINTIIYE